MRQNITLFQRLTYLLIITVLGYIVLTEAKHIFQPLALALLFSYLLFPIVNLFENKWKLSRGLSIILSLLVGLIIVSVVVNLIIMEIRVIIRDFPAIKHQTVENLKSWQVFIENKFHIYLAVPKGYNINIDTTDFMWISRETVEMSQGLIIYSYPYNDTSDFNVDSLIAKRDDFLKRFIKGPTFGSWMSTEKRVRPEVNRYVKNGKFYVKMRGLWKVENDYMGGPFVSVSTLNADNSRIITVEGYVYAPKYKKREYVRQLEAILSTLQVIDKVEKSKEKR